MNREQKIKELETKLAEITSEIEEIKMEQPKTVWDLKDGDKYWWLTSAGHAQLRRWDRDDTYDTSRRPQGTIFLTRDEAERERDYRAALTRVKRRIAELNDGWTPDWRAYEYKYCVYYDYDSVPALITHCTTYAKIINSDMQLKSRLLAQQLIEEMPEDLRTVLTY